MKVVIVNQARMTSTRLPGKILKEVLGKPLLAYQIERLRGIPSANQIVVATTTNWEDDVIEAFCVAHGLTCFRGSEEDVLSRYYGAARANGADVVVRVTSDCPLIDPAVSERVIRRYLDAENQYDYVSNTLERTYPRGLDTEVLSFGALEMAHRQATLPYEREHVTPFVYTHPERFRIAQVTDEVDRNEQRWTVDTLADFEFVRRVLESIYPANPNFVMRDVLDVLEVHPDWRAINAHVQQKKLGE
jgi:spore coat polysaccharide biosynthesis protein SpsF